MYQAVVLFCASALIQTISAQCIGAGYGLGGAWPVACDNIAPIGLYESAWNGPFCNNLGPAALAASNGAGLAVTSASPIAPTGVFMTSENCYEGPLSVIGSIPFLGAVAVEGALPTIGGGAVTYSCGNGNVAILNEDFAPLAGPVGFGAYGYDGLAGPIGFGAYGYDGLAGPYGCAGTYGYDGLAGPYGCAGTYGYDGLAGPYGCAGPYGYDGLGYGYGPNGCGCGGALY